MASTRTTAVPASANAPDGPLLTTSSTFRWPSPDRDVLSSCGSEIIRCSIQGSTPERIDLSSGHGCCAVAPASADIGHHEGAAFNVVSMPRAIA